MTRWKNAFHLRHKPRYLFSPPFIQHSQFFVWKSLVYGWFYHRRQHSIQFNSVFYSLFFALCISHSTFVYLLFLELMFDVKLYHFQFGSVPAQSSINRQCSLCVSVHFDICFVMDGCGNKQKERTKEFFSCLSLTIESG